MGTLEVFVMKTYEVKRNTNETDWEARYWDENIHQTRAASAEVFRIFATLSIEDSNHLMDALLRVLYGRGHGLDTFINASCENTLGITQEDSKNNTTTH